MGRMICFSKSLMPLEECDPRIALGGENPVRVEYEESDVKEGDDDEG
ncbi:hypothetical protein L3N51_01457 [Metallosphaera sp. J1]|nr:hypothetical protein [Metallosphaera javensis (ex Hofmann et al. 2022)]MCG3109167.1 hypothetical protein [Metallosphaera javensis (ex Hofmann et al. 2022)]